MTSVYDSLIRQVSNTYGLPYDLLRAQVQQESGGDPFAFRYEREFFESYVRDNPNAKGVAVGPYAACSYGLLQIMGETALELGYTDRLELLFNPKVGLAWGAKQMAKLVTDANGNYTAALAAYNGGASLVHKPSSAWPSLVSTYVRSVYDLAGRSDVA